MTMPMFVGKVQQSSVVITYLASDNYTSEEIASMPGSAGQFAFSAGYAFDSDGFGVNHVPFAADPPAADFSTIGSNITVSPGYYLAAGYKVLTANDVGEQYFGVWGGSTTLQIISRFSITGTVGTPTSINSQGTTGNPSVQTVTPSTQYGIGYAIYSASSAVSPRTSSITATQEVNNTTQLYIKFFVFDSVIGASPGSFTVDQADEGSANLLKSGWFPVT